VALWKESRNRKGNWFKFDGEKSQPALLHWINRVLNPVVNISSSDEANKFMLPALPFEDKTGLFKQKYIPSNESSLLMTTRVLAIIQDKGDYKQEMENFLEACETLSYRKDLRCGIIHKFETKKQLYNEHKYDWFAEGSSNTIVLIRKDNTIAKYEIESEETEIRVWLTDQSLHPLQEMNFETEVVMQKVTKPVWVFFVALNEEKHSQKLVSKNKNFIDWVKHLAFEY
jgi:hypothetical protein